MDEDNRSDSTHQLHSAHMRTDRVTHHSGYEPHHEEVGSVMHLLVSQRC